MNPTVGDFTGNAAKLRQFTLDARERGADLVVFPELAVCGYPPRDLVESPAFVARSRQVLEQLAAEISGIAIIAGLPTPAAHETGKTVMNSAALLRDGRIDFIQSKRLLPTYDVFDEMRNFSPALTQRLFCLGGKAVALTICEDAWNDKAFWSRRMYGHDPVEDLVRAGGELVLNISASPFNVGKRELRQAMLASIARQHRVPVLLVNQVGGNDSLVFDGSSLALNHRRGSCGAGKVVRGRSDPGGYRGHDRRHAPAGRRPRRAAPMRRWCWARATTCANAASARSWWD